MSAQSKPGERVCHPMISCLPCSQWSLCFAADTYVIIPDQLACICSLTASLEARRAQLDISVAQLQQQLTDDSNAGLKILYGFLGLREIVDNGSSGTELQMVPENGKPTSVAPAMTRSSKSSKTLDNRQPSASLDAKGRRLSQQDPIVEALQILDVGNRKFEITSSLMARFAPDQPAEAEPESPRNTKPTGAKQSGQKAEVSKVAAAASQAKTKGKAAAAKTEADEPQKPSMEDEARQMLPTGADGKQRHISMSESCFVSPLISCLCSLQGIQSLSMVHPLRKSDRALIN